MHHIHLKDIHRPRGPNLFALSIGEIVCSCMALFFYLLCWAIGGDEFRNSIGGDIMLAFILLAVIGGAIFAVVTRPQT